MKKHPYPEGYVKASEYLRLTLAFLSKHKIPPSPVNYQIAYEYVTGRDGALKTNLEKLLDEFGTPSDEKMWELYQRYVHQDKEALDMIRQELRSLIWNIQGEFHRTGGNLQEYTRTLNQFASILDKPVPIDRMSTEVQKVLNDTQEVEISQNRMGSKIGNLLSEMDIIRRELE